MMRTMAIEREVTCPACSAPRRTKANRNVWITCPHCGHAFRAPGAADGAQPPAPAPLPGGVTVQRGSVRVPQAARPRARGTDAPPVVQIDPDAHTTGSAAEPATPPPPAPRPSGRTGDRARLVEAGRRGGLASYARDRVRV